MLALLFEAGVVAAVLALGLLLWLSAVGPITSVPQAALAGIVLGATVHIGFELAGANAYYCVRGHACSGAK